MGSSNRTAIPFSSPEKRGICGPCGQNQASFSGMLAQVSWSPSSVIVCELTWDNPSILVSPSLWRILVLGLAPYHVTESTSGDDPIYHLYHLHFLSRKPVKWHAPAFKPHLYKHTSVRPLLTLLHECCFLFLFLFYRWGVLRFPIFFFFLLLITGESLIPNSGSSPSNGKEWAPSPHSSSCRLCTSFSLLRCFSNE